MKRLTLMAILALVVPGGFGWNAPVEAQQPPKGRILYYRNPMGLPDTSPVPKKDQMGMDYIPVYEGEETQGNQIRISPEKVQKLGVKTEAASRRTLTRPVRLVGTVQVDERRLYTVAPRFEGWIRQLYVNATGHTVKRGEPLMEVYSPELVSAQQEYLIALEVSAPCGKATPRFRPAWSNWPKPRCNGCATGRCRRMNCSACDRTGKPGNC